MLIGVFGGILCTVLLATATAWLITTKPWLKPSPASDAPIPAPLAADKPQEIYPIKQENQLGR